MRNSLRVLPISILFSILSIIVWLSLSVRPAHAQGPTNACAEFNGVPITDTLTIDFSSGDFSKFYLPTDGEWNGVVEPAEEVVSCHGGNVGSFSGTRVDAENCNIPGDNPDALAFATTDLWIRSPVTATTNTIVKRVVGSSNIGVNLYCDGTKLGHVNASGLSIPEGFTCDGTLHFGNAGIDDFTHRYFGALQINCGTGDYDAYPSPTPQMCDLVPNADFTTTDDWTLFGTAAITNSILTLSHNDTAYQNLSGLSSNTTYNVTVAISNVISSTDIFVQLSNDIHQEIDVQPGIINVDLSTNNVAGPVLFALDAGGGTIDIDYACVSLAGQGAAGNEQFECIAPPNGEFTSADNWDFYRGASWNQPQQSADLPAQNQALMTASSSFTVPTLTAGEYLLLGFDAVSQGGDGYVTSRAHSFAAAITATVETYQTPYRYEIDISDIPNIGDNTANLAFANPGIDGYLGFVTENDVLVDNVCIFVSDRPLNLPEPTSPGVFTPVDLDVFYNCNDVERIVFSTIGIDLRYHRLNYETTPSVWDPSDWVPWLISAIWVFLEAVVCIFLVLFATIANLLEYILNNGLNIWAWVQANWQNLIPWAYEWMINAWTSNENWLEALRQTAEDWLTWGATSALNLVAYLPDLINNLATITLWFSAGLAFTWALLPLLFLWLITEGNNVIRELLNVLINDGWNAFLVALGNVIGEVLNVLIGIWNNSIVPYLEYILSFLVSTFLTSALDFISLVLLFWDLFWAVTMYIWVNVFQSINIPISFYTGLSDGIQSTAFSDLLSCDGSTLNFWCNFFAALDLMNGIAGHSIFYPIVIVGIIVATIAILYRNVIALWNFYAEWIAKL